MREFGLRIELPVEFLEVFRTSGRVDVYIIQYNSAYFATNKRTLRFFEADGILIRYQNFGKNENP